MSEAIGPEQASPGPFVHLEGEMARLGIIFHQSLELRDNSLGIVVTEQQTHGWAVERLQEELADISPRLISSSNVDQTIAAIMGTLRLGEKVQHKFGSTILDLSRFNYDNPNHRTRIDRAFAAMNQNKSALINSALITVLVVPAEKPGLYQQLSDLYSVSKFVARFPAATQ